MHTSILLYSTTVHRYSTSTFRYTYFEGKVDSRCPSRQPTTPSRPWPTPLAKLSGRQTPPPQTLSRLSALNQPNPTAQDAQDEARARARTRLKKGFHSPCTQQPRRQRSPAHAANYHAKPPTQQHCPPEPQQAQRRAAARALARVPWTRQNVPGVSAAGAKDHCARLRPRGLPTVTARCVPSRMQAYRLAALSRVCLDPGDCRSSDRQVGALDSRQCDPRGGTGWYPHLVPHKCPQIPACMRISPGTVVTVG